MLVEELLLLGEVELDLVGPDQHLQSSAVHLELDAPLFDFALLDQDHYQLGLDGVLLGAALVQLAYTLAQYLRGIVAAIRVLYNLDRFLAGQDLHQGFHLLLPPAAGVLVHGGGGAEGYVQGLLYFPPAQECPSVLLDLTLVEYLLPDIAEWFWLPLQGLLLEHAPDDELLECENVTDDNLLVLPHVVPGFLPSHQEPVVFARTVLGCRVLALAHFRLQSAGVVRKILVPSEAGRPEIHDALDVVGVGLLENFGIAHNVDAMILLPLD